MDAHRRKITLHEEAIEFDGTLNLGHENDNLIKFESVEKIIQLPILLLFL